MLVQQDAKSVQLLLLVPFWRNPRYLNSLNISSPNA